MSCTRIEIPRMRRGLSVAWPEDQFPLVLVVPATAQGDIRRSSQAAQCIRLDMVELEVCAPGAATAVGRSEGALPFVPLPHRSANRARDVPGVPIRRAADEAIDRRRSPAAERDLRRRRCEARDGRCPGPRCHPAQLGLLQRPTQKRHGTLEDESGISIRYLSPQQVLDPSEVFVGVLSDGELDAIAVQRRCFDEPSLRGDDRRRRGCRHVLVRARPSMRARRSRSDNAAAVSRIVVVIFDCLSFAWD
jgi:hypothetical protein